jgi:hypothetical protein
VSIAQGVTSDLALHLPMGLAEGTNSSPREAGHLDGIEPPSVRCPKFASRVRYESRSIRHEDTACWDPRLATIQGRQAKENLARQH